ncbi:hypothetical protein FB45DRAFT_1000083 [Roridomyces roridus]|uniref:Uncharacterized protein n=1 Tax=Roridomyces roridus TaxID=1738132 RepID=A0AAD7C7L2_9AGAR|nr:hypothetical protein FB45DRAFT_1000083 [Roridomyces roridus]
MKLLLGILFLASLGLLGLRLARDATVIFEKWPTSNHTWRYAKDDTSPLSAYSFGQAGSISLGCIPMAQNTFHAWEPFTPWPPARGSCPQDLQFANGAHCRRFASIRGHLKQERCLVALQIHPTPLPAILLMNTLWMPSVVAPSP